MFLTHIQPLVEQHGYWFVFLIVMLESAGVPLPGESVLVLASIYAGATGRLDLSLVIACAAAGAITGDNIGFWVGRRWGTGFLLRYGKFFHLPHERLKLGQYLFKKHGGKIVFFGRFFAFLRVLAALLAGANKYRWPPFLFFNAAGGIIWALVFGISAFVFGDSIHRASGPLRVIALTGFIAGVIAVMYIVRREERRMEKKIARSDVDLHKLS